MIVEALCVVPQNRETEKAKFQASLNTAQQGIQAVSLKNDKLATELATRYVIWTLSLL